MSTYWGYRCETCNDDSESWLNHGEDTLVGLAQHYNAYKPILYLPRVLISVYPYDSAPVGFLQDHDGHVIVVLSEYGQVLRPSALLESEPPL